MQSKRKTSCFKRLKPESEPFLACPLSGLNDLNILCQTETSNYPQSPFKSPVVFPSERARIYKDLFCQVSNLQISIGELVSNYLEQTETHISATICILEKELISELIINLNGQAALLNDNSYFKSLQNNCSLKRMLDEICPVEPPLVFARKVEVPLETRKDEQIDILGSYEKARQINWKLSDSPPNDDIEVAAKDVYGVTDPSQLKNEVKRCFSTINRLFQAKSITQIQKSILKKGVLKNGREIIYQIQLYEKDSNLEPFLEYLEDYRKTFTANEGTRIQGTGDKNGVQN